MSGQSKAKSFIESLTNTFVGLLVTFMFSPFIFWMCGVPITYTQICGTTISFTILSILRNYFIRRFFNKLK